MPGDSCSLLGSYLIPPLLTAFVDIPVLYAGLPNAFLLVAPVAAYPMIAALAGGRPRKAPTRRASLGRAASTQMTGPAGVYARP